MIRRRRFGWPRHRLMSTSLSVQGPRPNLGRARAACCRRCPFELRAIRAQRLGRAFGRIDDHDLRLGVHACRTESMHHAPRQFALVRSALREQTVRIRDDAGDSYSWQPRFEARIRTACDAKGLMRASWCGKSPRLAPSRATGWCLEPTTTGWLTLGAQRLSGRRGWGRRWRETR
jgi:hypothetical protein